MNEKCGIILDSPPIFEDWEWKDYGGEHPKPAAFDECCAQCADYRIKGKGGKPVTMLFDTIMDACVSEEIMKQNNHKPLDHGLLLRNAMFTGCRFFRRKQSLSETIAGAFKGSVPQ
jgi:hypothetical protein